MSEIDVPFANVLARELRLSLALLARERDEMSGVLDAISEGILQLGVGATLVRANPAARTLLSLPDDAEGRTIGDLVADEPLRDFLEQAAAGRTLEPRRIRLGEQRLLLKGRALAPRLGIGAVVVITDLGELERFEAMRRDFVASASHELKTPLTAIRACTEVLLGDGVEAEQARTFLETIQRRSGELQQIVDQLLDLSRLESGGWRLDVEALDPVEAVQQAWEVLRPQAAAKRVELESPAGPGPLVRADGPALRRVLDNLLSNALRHTPPNGRISLEISDAPKAVTIAIRDTGCGIPLEALPRIFEPFYRVHPARSQAEGGSGLGLSIVRHLVEQMGGVVAAESTIGAGTTMRLRLPAARTLPGTLSPARTRRTPSP